MNLEWENVRAAFPHIKAMAPGQGEYVVFRNGDGYAARHHTTRGRKLIFTHADEEACKMACQMHADRMSSITGFITHQQGQSDGHNTEATEAPTH